MVICGFETIIVNGWTVVTFIVTMWLALDPDVNHLITYVVSHGPEKTATHGLPLGLDVRLRTHAETNWPFMKLLSHMNMSAQVLHYHRCDCNFIFTEDSSSLKPSVRILNHNAFEPHRTQWLQQLSTYPTFSHMTDDSMGITFDIHLAISSIHSKISLEFRFWANFFAFQNPDTRLKIFPTALKKFALRADYRGLL